MTTLCIGFCASFYQGSNFNIKTRLLNCLRQSCIELSEIRHVSRYNSSRYEVGYLQAF